MTSRPKRPRSYVINAALAGAVLYWVLDLSSSGRTLIDWVVIGLVIGAIAWNVVQLSRRLSEPLPSGMCSARCSSGRSG